MRNELSSPAIRRVLRGKLCSGCGACALVAPSKIAIRPSDDGFHRPKQSTALTPSEEERIANTCPGLVLRQNSEGRRDDTVWGPWMSVRTGYANDERLRYVGSSGGALSAVLAHLLSCGAVDFILHTGADPDNPLGNRTTISRTLDDILNAAGSRYAPSSPLADIEEHLSRGVPFAFVGKPCDVAALRALAEFDARINAVVPYMISFFCAGVPSMEGARQIVRKLGVNEAQVTAFRYRGNGWPGFATATLDDGGERKMSYADSWGRILTQHVQFRCKICPDGTGGLADLAFADAWLCDDNGYPLFEEEDGVSLIVSRTTRGERLVETALAAGSISASPIPISVVAPMQPGQHKRRIVVLSRIAALRALFRPVPQFIGFHLFRAALMAGLESNLRNFLGTGRRILMGKI